jgi:acyl-CoA dehydrogenase
MSERSLLADVVETFFSERCPPQQVAAIEAGADPDPLWRELEELGLTLAAVPEAAGGQGGSLLDALTIMRAAGRHAAPLPLAEAGLLAGWLLAEAGMSVSEGVLTVAPVRRGETIRITTDGGNARLDGQALRVPWARTAERIVVLALDAEGRGYVASVPPAAAQITLGHNLAGEPRDDVVLAGVVVAGDDVAPVTATIEQLQLRGALARSVMMLGALERVRDLTVAWSKDRVQFGRPISKFQAVQHLLAELARDVAVARAAVDLAVSAAVDDIDAAWLEIASAKLVCGRAAGSVAARAHQVHGAIGVTKEYSLSVLTRRLWSWRDEFGSETEWAQQIGAEAWREPRGVWSLVTAGRIPTALVQTA